MSKATVSARHAGLTWTFHIHEVRIRALHQPLQFVLSLFRLRGRVEQVHGQLPRYAKDRHDTRARTHDHIPPTPSISAMANRVNEFESFIFVQHKCTSAPLSAKGRHVRLTGISQQRHVRPPYATTRQEDRSREWMPNKAVLMAQQNDVEQLT